MSHRASRSAAAAARRFRLSPGAAASGGTSSSGITRDSCSASARASLCSRGSWLTSSGMSADAAVSPACFTSSASISFVWYTAAC